MESFNAFLAQIQQAAAITAAIAATLSPVVGPLLVKWMAEQKRLRLLNLTKAAYKITAELAARTHISASDGLARTLRLVAEELGHELTSEERDQVTRFAATMHSDVMMPGSLGSGIGDALLPAARL